MREFEKDSYLLFKGEELPNEALQFILEKKNEYLERATHLLMDDENIEDDFIFFVIESYGELTLKTKLAEYMSKDFSENMTTREIAKIMLEKGFDIDEYLAERNK